VKVKKEARSGDPSASSTPVRGQEESAAGSSVTDNLFILPSSPTPPMEDDVEGKGMGGSRANRPSAKDFF